MAHLLITGSIAYDHLMRYDGLFKETILPEELDNLSVSFQARAHERFYGGCAPNIAYTMTLFGMYPLISGRAGVDFELYSHWLSSRNLSLQYVTIDQQRMTASAYILSDARGGQISFFAPGAMYSGDVLKEIEGIEWSEISLVCIAPDAPHRMEAFVDHCISEQIPYIFDPGQAITALSADVLKKALDGAMGIIVNRYEGDLLAHTLSSTFHRIATSAGFCVRTLGEHGAEVYFQESFTSIPPIADKNTIEITGCGDAFRAGFLYGLMSKKPLPYSCALGNTAASYVLESKGTQEHHFSHEAFKKRFDTQYRQLFGECAL